MATVKINLHKKVARPSDIATNTMALCGPISGIFTDSVVLLDGTELTKLNGQHSKGGSEKWNGIHAAPATQRQGTIVKTLISAHTNHST